MDQLEPFGHRGHPTEGEVRQARRLAVYVERAIRRLMANGFDEQEAVAFIAGLATGHAERTGESWVPGEPGAMRTVQGIREGRAAKQWSHDASVLALFDVGELTTD